MAKSNFFYGVSNCKISESEKRYIDIALLFIQEFYCKLNDKKEYEFMDRKSGEVTRKMLLTTTKSGIITYPQLKKCVAIANKILLDKHKIDILLGLPEISTFGKNITVQCQFMKFDDNLFSKVNCKKPVENNKKSGENKNPRKPEIKTPENKTGDNKPENEFKPEIKPNKNTDIFNLLDKITTENKNGLDTIIKYLEKKGYKVGKLKKENTGDKTEKNDK